jgi:peroxiredoxin
VFAKALCLDLNLSAGGLGRRSKRCSMLVLDGVVKESAEHLLGQIK